VNDLVLRGARCESWDFSLALKQAARRQHERLSLLSVLAEVITGRAPMESLGEFLEFSADAA
jgi:hypothetical protein